MRFASIQVLFLTVLLFVSFVGTSAKADPTDNDVREHIDEVTGDGVQVSEIRTKLFPHGQSGQGRVSVAGTLMVTENRYDITNQRAPLQVFVNELKFLGMSEEQIIRYGKLLGVYGITGWAQISVFEPKILAGTEIPFSAELTYLETVDGHDFSGRIAFELCCKASAQLLHNEVASDSARYRKLIADMIAWRDYEAHTLPQTALEHFGGLISGSTLLENGEVVAELEPIDFASAQWSVQRGLSRNGHPRDMYTASFPTRVISRGSKPLEIGWRQVAVGSPEPVSMVVRMDLINPVPSESCVQVQTSDWLSRASCLDGSAFSIPGDQYGGLGNAEGSRSYVLSPNAKGSPRSAQTEKVDELVGSLKKSWLAAQGTNGETLRDHLVEASYAARRLVEDYPHSKAAAELKKNGLAVDGARAVTKELADFLMMKACAKQPTQLCLVDMSYVLGERSARESIAAMIPHVKQNPRNVSPSFALLFRGNAAAWYAVLGLEGRVEETYAYHLKNDTSVGVQNLALLAPRFAFAFAAMGHAEKADSIRQMAVEAAAELDENEVIFAETFMGSLPAWKLLGELLFNESTNWSAGSVDGSVVLQVLDEAYVWFPRPLLIEIAESAFERCLEEVGFKPRQCAGQMARLYALQNRPSDALAASERAAPRKGELHSAILALTSIGNGNAAANLYESLDDLQVRSPSTLGEIGSAGMPEYLKESLAAARALQNNERNERDIALQLVAFSFAKAGKLQEAKAIARELENETQAKLVEDQLGYYMALGAIQSGDIERGLISAVNMEPMLAISVVNAALGRLPRPPK